MKQKDIALVIMVVGIAAFVSFFVSSWLFQSGDKKEQKAEVVDVITTDFQPPSDQYFNSNSIDPTQLITIGGGDNDNPFKANQ